MMKLRSLVTHMVLPVSVLAVGVMGMRALIAARPEAPRRDAPVVAPLVEVIEAASATGQRATVRGLGTVKAARVMTLTPEVSGRVVAHHPALVPGGRLASGEPVLSIDDRDYKLAIAREHAMVTRAQSEVALEKGRAAVAQREWEIMEGQLGGTAGAKGRELALRQPQRRAATASVTMARSALKRAKLALERTEIHAPFDAFVQKENVEEGQWVGPGTPLATLVGTEHFWVEVSVPVAQLEWLGMGSGSDAQPTATVSQQIGGGELIVRKGRVLRVLDQLDPVGRMARLLIEVDDPLGLSASPRAPVAPLRLGAFVEVSIEGRSLDGGVAIPRDALRDGSRLWIVTESSTLEIRPVTPRWTERDKIVVGPEVRVGERVVLSAMTSPSDGMPIRVVGEKTAHAEDDAASPGSSP